MTPVEKVEIKSKGTILGTYEYEAPEDLEEALDSDGEDKVFSLYLQKRKTNWMDAKRRELTGGGLPKEVVKALKDASPDKLKAIAEQLNVDVA